MPRRTPNPKLPKIHRNYTMEEAASLLGVHRNTVRLWIEQGLETCDSARPTLILGRHLAQFLAKKRVKHKRTCEPGQLYCVRCRTPRSPLRETVGYQATGTSVGNLTGTCSDCGLRMNRRVSEAKLDAVLGNLRIHVPQAMEHITESTYTPLNSDLESGDLSDVKARTNKR